jgi:hypothetical protein
MTLNFKNVSGNQYNPIILESKKIKKKLDWIQNNFNN